MYLVCGKTDMCKSINDSSAIVESQFHLDTFDEAVFVFYNRNGDRLKIHEWAAMGSGCVSIRRSAGGIKAAAQ